jgi:acetylornithine deacetylase
VAKLATQDSVVERISPDQIVDLASDLIRIPSFKTEETEVALWLSKYFEERGYEVELQEVDPGRFQTIARLPGRRNGRSLMFNGHIDIDPLALDWRRDPWTPAVENGYLFGAGLNNMKGGVACMITAVEALREAKVPLDGDLVIACVAGELQGGVGTVHLVDRGIKTDMAVVAEPYGARNAITAHAGWTQLALSTIGFSRHVTQKSDAVDAIKKMMKVIAALDEIKFTCTPRPELPALPFLSVGCIIGGRGRDHVLTGPNFISDYCTILVDVRFLAGQTPDSVRSDIEAVLENLKRGDPELQYEIEHPPGDEYRVLRVHMEPFEVSTDEEIVQTVAAQVRKVTGDEPHVGLHMPLSYGGDDCCHLWRGGIPSVLYGPAGEWPTRDQVEDRMAIEEMTIATRVLALTALEVCGAH